MAHTCVVQASRLQGEKRLLNGHVSAAVHDQLKALMRGRHSAAANHEMTLAFQYKCLVDEWQAYLQGDLPTILMSCTL